MNVQLLRDCEHLNLAEMEEIYHLVGWKRHNQKIIQQVFTASNVICVALRDQHIIGFGRAMSDGVFNAAIYDVVVHPDFQKSGVVKRIVEDLLNQLKDISCIHLIATTGNEDFYRNLGFNKTKTGMARYLNPNLTMEYLDS
ncbi:GNAT family N-acetyltransferase [Heyndrickxia ginsengihumi]|uniref:GNAT family N-acetyltransferase n=1 Tax=Heyndrickxia ginsengihumi TaxID=363870 RepID=UPI002040426A|nr:GNAT family N-acetyltransferase [Heyndrickxia ginsengihumi]MCM3024156.1 GNAT family N-acetyltransferase [Heyndrickxia ginsengihumi]